MRIREAQAVARLKTFRKTYLLDPHGDPLLGALSANDIQEVLELLAGLELGALSNMAQHHLAQGSGMYSVELLGMVNEALRHLPHVRPLMPHRHEESEPSEVAKPVSGLQVLPYWRAVLLLPWVWASLGILFGMLAYVLWRLWF